ncbi:hypothetical protein [Chryseobacterium geocarposphaerae]|uniref:hypothetical protein n=1 Tax=Chryseobacterium geocarposphaerae TaxID=1416776 RepID=UPI0014732F65|nr:hypothetical protein [Chryseobacterium geocarposphaerae]
MSIGRKVENTIDTKKLDTILGITGDMNNGVYKYTIGPPEVAPVIKALVGNGIADVAVHNHKKDKNYLIKSKSS